MLLAYLLRETGLGSALTQTRSLQRSRGDPVSPKKRGHHESLPSLSTHRAVHASHQRTGVSMLPSPLLDEHRAETTGGSAALAPRAMRSPHSSHGAVLFTATPWNCSQKDRHPSLDQDCTTLEPFPSVASTDGLWRGMITPNHKPGCGGATEEELLLEKGTRLHPDLFFFQAASRHLCCDHGRIWHTQKGLEAPGALAGRRWTHQWMQSSLLSGNWGFC